MDELWVAAAELARTTVTSRLESFANVIVDYPGPRGLGTAARELGANAKSSMWQSLEASWTARPNVTGAELAAALRTGNLVHQRDKDDEVDLDLVWTGPTTDHIPIRRTEQVMLEVIAKAEKRLFLISFVSFKAYSIIKALNAAVSRGVVVNLLLEEEKGAADNLRKAVPRGRVWVWREGVSVHAKCVVADDTSAFITSANLTSKAMERNMELGVLIRGGREPARLHDHLEMLITAGTIRAFE